MVTEPPCVADHALPADAVISGADVVPGEPEPQGDAIEADGEVAQGGVLGGANEPLSGPAQAALVVGHGSTPISAMRATTNSSAVVLLVR